MNAENPNATDYLLFQCTAEMLTVDADFDRFYDGLERARYIHQCRLFQLSRLGLLPGKYWRDARVAAIAGPQESLQRPGFYSGFCDRSRGRHWDRRRIYK